MCFCFRLAAWHYTTIVCGTTSKTSARAGSILYSEPLLTHSHHLISRAKDLHSRVGKKNMRSAEIEKNFSRYRSISDSRLEWTLKSSSQVFM